MEEDEMTVEEMREEVAAADAAAAQAAAEAEAARLAPYQELRDMPELALVKAKLAELRPLYLNDDPRFRKIDAALLMLKNL